MNLRSSDGTNPVALDILVRENFFFGCFWDWPSKIILIFLTHPTNRIVFKNNFEKNSPVTLPNDYEKCIFLGEIYGINVGLKNRMLCLFKRITSPNMCTRRCGLVWRLYLQFVYTYYSPDICRNVYYRAVEECPWLKVGYYLLKFVSLLYLLDINSVD